MAGKVVGLGFEIISKLDSHFLMTVRYSITVTTLLHIRTQRSDVKKFISKGTFPEMAGTTKRKLT